LITVKIEDKKSEWNVVNGGVRQDCRLFIIYMNAIVKECRQNPHGYVPVARSIQLDVILSADDLALLA
jgi:hypothetical protein